MSLGRFLMVDLMLGYVKGGEDVHVSAMVAFPLNHTSRADVGFFVTFGSGF
jgi:hypothetical protein